MDFTKKILPVICQVCKDTDTNLHGVYPKYEKTRKQLASFIPPSTKSSVTN